MNDHEHTSLLQLHLILGDREDVRRFSNHLLQAINPNFLKRHADGTPPETIVIALLGSFDSLKSALADDMADCALPRKKGEVYLSGYLAEHEELPFKRRGESVFANGEEIELTFSDPSNEKLCEDRTLPAGIDFQQNVLPQELKSLWLSITMQEAPPSNTRERKFDAIMSARAVVAGNATPEQEMDFHDLNDEVDINAAQETLDRFDYVDDAALKAATLKTAFDNLNARPDVKPRLVTLNVYKPELLNDEQFMSFIENSMIMADFTRNTGELSTSQFFPDL